MHSENSKKKKIKKVFKILSDLVQYILENLYEHKYEIFNEQIFRNIYSYRRCEISGQMHKLEDILNLT